VATKWQSQVTQVALKWKSAENTRFGRGLHKVWLGARPDRAEDTSDHLGSEQAVHSEAKEVSKPKRGVYAFQIKSLRAHSMQFAQARARMKTVMHDEFTVYITYTCLIWTYSCLPPKTWKQGKTTTAAMN